MAYSKQDAYWAAVASDFNVFLQQAFHELYPGQELMGNWHIDAIAYHLELCIEGKMRRLIINLPPRHLKSFIVSVALPAFLLGMDPTVKIFCVSYSDDLAKTLARDFRRIVESNWYQKIFPNVMPSKMTENEFATKAGGFRYATSVGGTLTGRGADFIIIDDPLKAGDAYSDKLRQSVNDWYTSTLLSRLNDKEKGIIILVMQRLHINDLTGFAGDNGGFHKLSFPAFALNDEHIQVSNTENYLRKEGEPLHAEREGMGILERLRDEVGSNNFSAQYQQRPETPDGAIFKLKWIKIIEQPPIFDSSGALWVSIDSAQSTSETADYSAISFGYSNETGHYVLFAERGHWDYETLLAKALGYHHRYGERIFFIVEAASNGISLIHSLRKRGLNCIHHFPKDGKVRRAYEVVDIVESGRLHIINQKGKNDWVESYINELVTFPLGRYDDQVDSLVQVLKWAERNFNPAGQIYLV